MTKAKNALAITSVLLVAIGVTALARAQENTMSFFITSVGVGKGGNLGGLEGADRHCQSLAQAVGAGGKTWRAYLSTQGPGGGNAKDRNGNGPRFNATGNRPPANPTHLHSDTTK